MAEMGGRDFEHDTRLDLVNPSQYRLWHDSHEVLVPLGESTTQPKSKEKVNTKVEVFGEINKGYFKKPLVQFLNTNVDTEIFDGFYLRTWRYNLPDDTDWNENLGIEEVWIEYDIALTNSDTGIMGYAQGVCSMKYDANYPGANIWLTDKIPYGAASDERLQGHFQFYSSLPVSTVPRGTEILTGEMLNFNIPMNVLINDCTVVNGNSRMELLLAKNSPINANVDIDFFDFSVIGGG